MTDIVAGSGQPLSPFDRIKQTRLDGTEFWFARDLQGLMAYGTWERFSNPLQRAIQSASNTGMAVTSHFRRSAKPPRTGGKPREDYELSREAAYLVAMNGDPNKPEVAAAQAYFAARTVQAETVERRVARLPSWAIALHELVDQQATLEIEQQRQADQLREVAARVDSIEGAHDWYSALAYARLHGFTTERTYLQRVGVHAGRILRQDGEQPGKTQHPAFGTVNTYPAWVLERAFAETPIARGGAE
ncbi:hypothetical protein [Amycolatopsis anabasis]|uniref:hypothetical protein n=1 Tax=Amycolatopsis anabasis TaxID=1840409 RepID=UPI00131D0F04|nr:hypothetical protein [Amycolatopsis anabasis]